MTQESITIFIEKNYSKPPKQNYTNNKTDVYLFDDIWSLDSIELQDYGSEKKRNYRNVLVMFDIFSKFGWTVPSKNKNAQTIKDAFEINLSNKKKFVETFWKDDTINWSYKLYEITENINDIIQSYRLDSLRERYNKTSLTKTNLTLKENKDGMKALNLN